MQEVSVKNATSDYEIELSKEMTETELMEVPEPEKMMMGWCIEHNTEKKVIEIRPGNSDCITLYGAQDARDFINALEDTIQQMF